MTVPALMKAALLDGPKTLTVREVPVPDLDQYDVLVQVTAVGLCGSDVHFYDDGRVGDLVVNEPLVLGHEASGVIVAVGSAVGRARIGQRVAVEPQRPCRRCTYCLSGRYNLCRSMEFSSAPPVHGAFAEYLAAPADFAHPVEDTISDDAAALIEPLSVAVAAARKAGVTPGSAVLVAGAGPIGILCAQAARAFGATTVIVTDPLSPRRSAALRAGATTVLDPRSGDDPLPPEESVDMFIDTSGAETAIRTGLRCLRPGGRAVLVGMGAAEVRLDLFLLQSRELVVEGLFRYVNTWPTAIALVQSGVIDLDCLVTGRFDLAELPVAMERNGDADVVKLMIHPGGRPAGV